MLKVKESLKNKIRWLNKKFHLDFFYLFKNSFWITLDQSINIITGIIISIAFARFTSKETLGNYSFLLSIIAMLSILSIPGLNTSTLRSFSKGFDGVYKKSARLSFVWSLLGIPILIFIGGYYYFFDNKLIGIILFITSIFFPFLYAPQKWSPLLQGKKKFNSLVKYSIISVTTNTIFVTIAIFIEKGNLIPIFIVYLIINSFFNCFYYLKSKKFLRNNKEDKNWKKSGFQLSFVNFVSFIYDYADKILVGILMGPVDLAIYTIAVSLIIRMRSFLKSILTIIYPKIFDKKNIDLKKITKSILIKIFTGASIISFITALIMPYLIKILYSTKYNESIIYAQIYLITIPLAVIFYFLSTVFIALEKEKIIIILRVISVIINVLLYFILIPLLGILGAILASIIYFVITDASYLFYLFKKENK